jgi:hypothetical protein
MSNIWIKIVCCKQRICFNNRFLFIVSDEHVCVQKSAVEYLFLLPILDYTHHTLPYIQFVVPTLPRTLLQLHSLYLEHSVAMFK